MNNRITNALVDAGLGFSVFKESLSSPSGPVPGKIVRRSDTGAVLGRPVSSQYVPLCHLQAFSHVGERLDRLEAVHGPAEITVADQHEGATARVLIAFPESESRARSEVSHLYPAALFTHGIGGTAGLTARAGASVAVCMNGMFFGESLRLATRHTTFVRSRLVSLNKVMEDAISETAVFASELDEFSRVPFDPEFAFEAFSYINRGRVVSPYADSLTPKEQEIMDSYNNGPGNAKGTAAGLIQAVTHYTTHKSASSERLELDSANAQLLLGRAREVARLASAQGIESHQRTGYWAHNTASVIDTLVELSTPTA